MTTPTIEAPEAVELTEFEAIDVQKVSGVAQGANGFPHLMLKGIAKADANEPHGAFTGSHSHGHPAFGGPDGDGDGSHEHKHSHDGDADHHHQHGSGMKAVVNGKVDQKPDVALGEKILALIGQAMGNESQEVAAGHHGEAGDVHMLAQAHDIVHAWCNGEKTHPDGLKSAAEDDMEKAKLDAAARNSLPDSAFALPGRRYPIHDENHARAALSEVAQHGTPEEKAKVRAAVHRKYPDIGGDDSDSKSSKSVVAEGGTTVEDVTQGNDDLAKAVEAAVTKALESHTAEIATLRDKLAKVMATPVPGGPVLSANARPQAVRAISDEQTAKAARYEALAISVSDPDMSSGYQELARQARQEAAKTT